jgi:hypothetical protein
LGKVNELADLDSCLLQQLMTVPQSVGLSVDHSHDPGIDDCLRTSKTGLIGTEQLSTFEPHTPPSCEGYGVLLGVHSSKTGLLRGTGQVVFFVFSPGDVIRGTLLKFCASAGVITVLKTSWGSVVALHQYAAFTMNHTAYMESAACRSAGPDESCFHQ